MCSNYTIDFIINIKILPLLAKKLDQNRDVTTTQHRLSRHILMTYVLLVHGAF